MFSPSIQRLLEDKSGSFIIPASRIAFVEDDNPLYHAFMILTRVKYSKIPVLDNKNRVVGLLSLAMITDKMMVTDKITLDPLTELKVKDVMQTNFDKINFAQTTLEAQLHLLVDNAFLPVVDDHGVFQGLLTRREWIKAFNYVAHNFENKYQVKQIDDKN
ncbi:cyclic-di-AMP-binding protein CbpB [Lactobacillus apis]|uniref:cyclic-di-AMP-binding protein CbpB n=1 Tax=Lactobacillus apis TaxID=303541 RepID=UPI002430BF2D|nr:cyclic-di-AMP-binding protein CbpB [Lactobacillus apis]